MPVAGTGSHGLGIDQAAGLRRWAEQQGLAAAPAPAAEPPPAAPAERRTLMVVGLSSGPERQQLEWVRQALARWYANGHAWLGAPDHWRLVALQADSPHLHTLACQQPRWGLWVDGDLDSFRRAYLCLRRLRESGGPRRLLVLHPGFPSHAGLLDNLRQAAARFLDIELLLLAEQPVATP